MEGRSSAQRFEVSLKPILLQIVGVALGLLALGVVALGPGAAPPFELVALALPIAIAVHEVTHALAATLLGARGFKCGLARAGSIVVGFSVGVREPMPLKRWLLVALAPLLLLSPLLFALARAGGALAPLFASVFLFNFAGSSGDVVLAWIAASAGRGTVRDFGDRVLVEGSQPSFRALLLLDAVALLSFAPVAASLAVPPILMLVAPSGSLRLEIAGLLVAERVALPVEGRGYGVEIRVGPGAVLPAVAVAAVLEAVSGPRRARRLLQELLAAGAAPAGRKPFCEGKGF